MTENGAQPTLLSQQLLLTIAEQMKLPLMQIARKAEQGDASDLPAIQSTADMAVRLLDNYALGVRLSQEPAYYSLEPVTVSSVLYDSGQQLTGLAKTYGVDLQLEISGRYGPVMANRAGLQAALVSLGAALIEALPAIENSQLKLQLAAHRSRYGVVAGVYADTNQLTSTTLKRARRLQAMSRQPFTNVSHTGGAGIFVADTILHAMRLNLSASRHRGLYGLGTVLQPNNQMQLI